MSYVITLKTALASLSLAQAQAEAELPPAIRREHWLMCRHMMSAAAWEELYMKYTLFPLKALAEIASMQAHGHMITGWREPEASTAPNLKVGRMR